MDFDLHSLIILTLKIYLIFLNFNHGIHVFSLHDVHMMFSLFDVAKELETNDILDGDV